MPKPSIRPTRPPWNDELAKLPARLLSGLPLASRFTVKVPGIASDVVFCTHLLAEPRPRSLEPTFDAAELTNVVLGVEADRLSAEDFRRLCAQKVDDPHLRVGPEHGLAGAQPDTEVTLTLAAVLRALEAQLLRVTFVEDASDTAAHPLEAAA